MSDPLSIAADARETGPTECVDCELEIEPGTTHYLRGTARCWACHGHAVLHAAESLTIDSDALLALARDLEAVIEAMESEARHKRMLEEIQSRARMPSLNAVRSALHAVCRPGSTP